MSDEEARVYMQNAMDRLVRDTNERLEQEALMFVRMGYTFVELTVVQLDDGTKEVSPTSAIS